MNLHQHKTSRKNYENKEKQSYDHLKINIYKYESLKGKQKSACFQFHVSYSKNSAGLMYFEVSVKFASYFCEISIKITMVLLTAYLLLSPYLTNSIIR